MEVVSLRRMEAMVVGSAWEILAGMVTEQILWKPGQLGGRCRGRYP